MADMDPMVWQVGARKYPLGERTLVMGILNVTPDSFSDGGLFDDPVSAVARSRVLVSEGADILDIGGESTRPGSEVVEADEEIARTVPVIQALVAGGIDVPISIDTRKAAVAEAACVAGATIVNDVSAGEDDAAMFSTVAACGAAMVLMHKKGEPKTMQDDPTYEDVVAEVRDALADRLQAARDAGIADGGLCVDPGIGFGKSVAHNLSLMKHLVELAALERPVLVGPSRKAFIGTLLDVEVDERLEGTAAAVAWLVGNGAHIVRVHDVKEMTRVVRIVDAIRGAH